MSLTPAPQLVPKPPETLSERFWSLARGMESDADGSDPLEVVRHVLAVLDKLDAGEIGGDITVNTLSFLALLRQQQVRGDLLYASPEQIRGESMDERSLVFSVGVLLFEKLTGRHPFGAEGNPNRVARMRRGELASGVNFFPKVPAALRTVLVKAMGPFPEERFANLAALRARLEAYVGGRLDDASDAAAATKPPRLPAMPERDSVWPKELDEREPVFRSQLARRRSVTPVLWMSTGAALASLVFLIAWPRGESTAAPAPAPAPAPAAVASAPAATTPVSSEPVPSAAPTAITAAIAPEVPPEGTAAADVAAVATEALPAATDVPPPSPAAFDPDLGAENALAAARECFGVERLADGVEFGATLVYSRADGLTRKIYYGNVSALSSAERRCLSRTLIGISAGAVPARNTLVVHSFYLSGSGGRVKARIAD